MDIIDTSPSDQAMRQRVVGWVATELILLTVLPPVFVVAGYEYVIRTQISALAFPERVIMSLLVVVVLSPLGLLLLQIAHYILPISRSDMSSPDQ